MKDISLDEIADRIIDAILNERHINREILQVLKAHTKDLAKENRQL